MPLAMPIETLATTDPVDAGTYGFTANGGSTTFTLPAGWSVPLVGHLDFALAPVGAGPDDAIRVLYDMRISRKDVVCSEQPEPGIEGTAEAMIGDLVARPGLVASEPVPVTIGGLDGLQVDLAMAADHTADCPFDPGVPSIPLIVDTVPSIGPFFGIGGPGERIRLIVLDRTDGQNGENVVLLIDAVDPAAFDALVAEAMPVIETFHFE
jgi:hypothetical protein